MSMNHIHPQYQHQQKTDHRSLEAIIWDLDGVIIDSSTQHRRAWQQLAAEEGVSFTDADFWATFGRSNAAIIPLHWGIHLSREQVDALAQRKEIYFRELVRQELSPLPGALELLQAAHESGIKQSLASSTPYENIALIAQLLGLDRWLDAVVSGDGLPHGKPAPDVFLLAAEKLNVPPVHCVVIEDAPAGVAAAKAGGMTCLAVTTSHPESALRAADHIVSSLQEASLALLQELLSSAT